MAKLQSGTCQAESQTKCNDAWQPPMLCLLMLKVGCKSAFNTLLKNKTSLPPTAQTVLPLFSVLHTVLEMSFEKYFKQQAMEKDKETGEIS